MIDRSRLADLALLYIVSVALRLPNVVGLGDLVTGDEVEYHTLAVHLAQGAGYVIEPGTPTAWRPPGLPALVSLVYLTTGPEPMHARMLLAALTSLTAPALYLLSLQVFARRSLALAAGGVWAALPTSIRLAGTLLGEPLTALLLVLAASAGLLAAQRRSAPLAAATGLLLGWVVLTRPYLAVAVLGAPALLLWRRSGALAAVAVCALALLPAAWTYRNAIQMGAPVLTTQTLEVWQGNNAWARGGWPGDVQPQLASLAEKYPDLTDLDEVSRSRIFVAEAVTETVEHPARILWLLPRKAAVLLT